MARISTNQPLRQYWKKGMTKDKKKQWFKDQKAVNGVARKKKTFDDAQYVESSSHSDERQMWDQVLHEPYEDSWGIWYHRGWGREKCGASVMGLWGQVGWCW